VTSAGFARGSNGHSSYPLEAAFDDDVSTSYQANSNGACSLEWVLPAGRVTRYDLVILSTR